MSILAPTGIRPHLRTGGAGRSAKLLDVRSSWPLTARSAQLERIGRWYADRQIGGVVLTGPAGVGKTRLGEEVLVGFTDARTSRAVGHPATKPIPFGALAHLLPTDLARDLGTGEDDRAALFHRARVSLAEQAHHDRLVLLVDDVDQLDATSLALLLPLTVDRTLFVVATLRAGQPAPDVIATLIKDGHLVVQEVPTLSTEEIGSLLDSVLDGPIDPNATAQLAARSQGNLQVLQELVRGAVAERLLEPEQGIWRLHALPHSGSLEELVTSHLDGIDAAARPTLDVLAVAGTVGLQDLEAIAEPRILEQLEAREVIRVMTDGRRTTVGLTHPVYGEVIRSQMTVLRTRAIQRELADQLDRHGARRREDVTRLALWRLEVGGEVDTDVLLRAGRLALMGRDAELAARFAAAAADRGATVAAAAIAVEAARLAADPDAIERAVAAVWDEPALSEDDRVHFARRLSMSRFSRGDLDGALHAVSDAEGRLVGPEHRAGVQAQRALLLASNGRPREALAVLADIDERVTAGLSDNRLRIELASARSTACLSVGRYEEAKAAARLGARAQRDLPEWLARRGMATHLLNEAHAFAYAGFYRDAHTLIETALESATRRNALAAQVWFEVVLGEIERDRGFGRASVDHFEAATALAEVAGQQAALVWAWVGVAQGQLILGETDAGADALSRADAAGDSPIATSWSTRERTRAWLLAGRGDLAAARRLLVEVADILRDDSIWPFEASLRHDLVRFGDPELAVDRLEELAHVVEGPLIQAFAEHARAAVSRDRVGYERAIAQFEAMDRVVSAAEAAVELADLLRQQGDGRAAVAAARHSQRLVDASGGARTPPLLRGATIEPLTNREREVALLAATGLASKQIAIRLSISKRTVDTHLDRIYRKLGVAGRDELAGALEPSTRTY